MPAMLRAHVYLLSTGALDIRLAREPVGACQSFECSDFLKDSSGIYVSMLVAKSYSSCNCFGDFFALASCGHECFS